jgi:DNA-binding transcriptional LysR family regulator
MGNSAQVAEMVKRRHVEMGFIEGRSTFPGLRSRIVRPDNLVVVVAPSHLWARRRQPLSASMLAATPLVLREVGSGTREVLESALAKGGLSITPLVELGSTTAIKAAIESGTGAAVLSRLATEADVANGHLIQVPIKGLDLSRSIRAVWARDRQLSNPAKRLLAQVKL